MFDPKSIGDHLPVVINGQNLVQVDSCRYLGIHIDNKLTWSVQVENVCIRVQQRLYFFVGWGYLVLTKKCCLSFIMLQSRAFFDMASQPGLAILVYTWKPRLHG